MGERSSLQKIVFILTGITLLLLVGAGFMLMLLSVKHNEFSQKEVTVSNQAENEITRVQYKTLLEETKGDRDTLAGYVIVGDAGTARLLANIESLATTQTLLVTESVNLEKVSSTTQALAVTVETEGGFQKVMAFLKSLESLPHEILFRDVVLQRSSELPQQDAEWSLSVAFTVTSFKP